jgi:hypothetical protein
MFHTHSLTSFQYYKLLKYQQQHRQPVMQKDSMTSRPAAMTCNVLILSFFILPCIYQTIRHALPFTNMPGKEHGPITTAKLMKSREKHSSCAEILHDRPSDTANEKPRMLSLPRRKMRSDTTKAVTGVLTA